MRDLVTGRFEPWRYGSMTVEERDRIIEKARAEYRRVCKEAETKWYEVVKDSWGISASDYRAHIEYAEVCEKARSEYYRVAKNTRAAYERGIRRAAKRK